MSRRDYQVIAKSLHDLRPQRNGIQYVNKQWAWWSEVVVHMANALAKDNPNFDKSKFLSACGPVPHGKYVAS